ncbi:MAG TPA: hypothetical protein VFZ50_01290 [Actinomycetota bacterium]|nr:hypothetical protein [Actinomycetota bacterium]
MKKWLFVMLALMVWTAATSQSAFGVPAATGVEKAKVRLLSPEEGAVVPQNDPSTGCTPTPNAGFGSVIEFAWRANHLKDIAAYQLFVQHPNATFPLVDAVVNETSFTLLNCGAFVIDPFLNGWQWRVRALDGQGNFSDWAEGVFNFAPCRLADGRPCGSL